MKKIILTLTLVLLTSCKQQVHEQKISETKDLDVKENINNETKDDRSKEEDLVKSNDQQDTTLDLTDDKSENDKEVDIEEDQIDQEESKNRIIDEISFEDLRYRAYRDRITVVKNNKEELLYQLDQKYNEEVGYEVHYLPDYVDLNISENGRILLFKFKRGESFGGINGIQTQSKELLWDFVDLLNASSAIWSPDNKQIAFIIYRYGMTGVKISKYGDIRSLRHLFYPEKKDDYTNTDIHRISYDYSLVSDSPVRDDSKTITDFYWKDNETFAFEPDIEEDMKKYHKSNFEDAGLSIEINEFKVR